VVLDQFTVAGTATQVREHLAGRGKTLTPVDFGSSG
jgi:hypothetical protein